MINPKVTLMVISMAIFCFDLGDTGEFRASTNSQVEDLKRKLDKATETIKLLNKSNSDARIEAQQIIATLEKNIADLKRELDNRHQSSDQNIAVWEQQVQDLTARVNDLVERALPFDCMKNIEDRDFRAAEEKLQLLRHKESLVADIVNKVYGGRIENIRLLNDFGKSLTTMKLSLIIYKPLADTLTANTVNTHTDELIDLLKSVEKEIINQKDVEFSTKHAAITVNNKLRESIKKTASKALQDAMLGNTLTTQMNRKLYTVDTDLFFDAITDAINKLYGNVDTKKILKYINGFEFLSHGLDGLTAIFNRMRNHGLHTDEMVELALYIQEHRKYSIYDDVYSDVRHRFERLKGELPQSLSALAFSKSVCLKNVRYSEYLFAGAYTRDSERRFVFTWQKGTRVCQGSWTIERQGGHLSIKNVHHNEYLFFSNYYNHGMYTWIPKSDIAQNKWRLISYSQGVQLKNEDEQVEITALGRSYNENRRYVSAVKADKWSHLNDLWMLEECNWAC